MNARERLFAALNGEPTDRVPAWLLFPYHRTSYYADVRTLPAWQEVFKLSLEKAITLNRRNLAAPLFEPEVETSHAEFEENGAKVSRTVYEWKGRRLFAETSISPEETKVKRLLESEEDLETFCSFPVLTDRKAVERHLDARKAAYDAERKEFPEELGAMMLDLGEPIGPLYHNANLEELSIWSVTRPELIEGFLERVMEAKRATYAYCLERRMAELYFLVGSELAAPPLVSLETFRRWIVPFAKELIDSVHAGGAKAVQHFHGKIRGLLPDFVEMGADALHTIEAPPVGDCPMDYAFKTTAGKLALIGNIQYDDFVRWSPERMREETERLLEECKGERLVLSPSAGPFDKDPPRRLLENYKAFLETAWDFPWR